MIELLISIIVALLVGLTAASTAMYFTASQRQGVSAGAASMSVTNALAAMKEDATQAGLGFFGDRRYLCSGLNLSVGTADRSVASFSPINVTRTAGTDQLDLVSAVEISAGANVKITATTDLTDARLQSFLPVSVGQAVLLSPLATGINCTVRTVTANDSYTPAGVTTPRQWLKFANTGAHNQVAFASPTQYVADSLVTLLGQIAWTRWRLSGEDLLIERPLDGTSAVMARNVVGLRVQYGVAAANTNAVASWQEPDTFGAITVANIAQVRVLRIGVTTRSPQPEKPDASGNCSATAARPRLLGFELSPPSSGGAAWNCYRYREAVVVIPLHNVVMGL